MPSGNSGTERPEGAGESRIGPNAILQVAAALRAAAGEEAARRVFAAAGLEAWLDHPPERMVPESAVAALHQALRAELDAAQARHVLQDAGVRTGDYVLAWRIPAPVRTLLRLLPPPLSGPLLLRAIERNAWTFVGSGTFSYRRGRPCLLEIRDNPVVAGERAEQPVCHWHASVFERLFQALVNRRSQVREVECAAAGGEACRFELRYR